MFRPTGRTAGRLAVTVVALLAAGIGAGWPVYVDPRVDPLPETPADAVVALGGDADTGSYAVDLARRGYARRVVLSDPYHRSDHNAVTLMCEHKPASPPIDCFAPDPATTRGEAEEIGRLARAGGWRRVVVVAPTYHVTRARLIVARCYHGDLRVVALPTPVSWSQWAYHYGYQTAGFAKAFVLTGC